jgi:hypothetical protein
MRLPLKRIYSRWLMSHIVQWKPVLYFVAAIGFSLLADMEIAIPLLIRLNCSGRLIPAVGSTAASLFSL